MKKKFPCILACILVFTKPDTLAQNWLLGGNALPVGGSSLGSNNSRPVIFETNNIERGRIAPNGFWGLGVNNPTAKLHINAGAGINPLQINVAGVGSLIYSNSGSLGVGTLSPNTKVHINSAAGENPFRVQVNGSSKLYVDNGGGVSVGSASIPPANGLFVSGNTGLGTTAPSEKLHVAGNILATGNIDVSGTVGFGSVETFSDGGSFTIQSNSDFVPNADGALNLGTAARTWASVHALSYLTTIRPTAIATAQGIKAGLPEIMKLRPITYTEGSNQKFGLIEKEVQSVLPEVTSDKEFSVSEVTGQNIAKQGKLSIEYDALIPVLIKGMQEQQKIIAVLQKRIDQLENKSLSASSSDDLNISDSRGARLEQNQPNPFNQTTLIRYKISTGSNAQINIYDASGVLVKTMRANESGQSQINGGDLKAGTYSYTLMVNGKAADSKKLILAR